MFASQVAEQAINLAVFVVLARILGAEIFGLAMMAVVFMLFCEYLVAQTVSEGLIQLPELDDGHVDAAFWSLLAIGICLMACIAISAGYIALFYSQPEVTELLYGGTPMILLVAVSAIPVALLRRQLRFKPLAVRAVSGAIGGGIVGILLALNGFGVWSIIGQRLALLLINAVVAWVAYPWRIGFRSTRTQVAEVLRFGLSMLGFRTSELLSLQTPIVALGFFIGPSAVGYFSIAWRLVEIGVVTIVNTFCTVAHPLFARFRTDPSRAGFLFREILNASTLLTFPSFVGLALIANPLIRTAFGDAWIPSIEITQILCLAGIFFAVERVQQAFLLGIGAANFLFRISFLEFLVAVVLISFLGRTSVVLVATMVIVRYYVLWPFRFAAVGSAIQIHAKWYASTFVPLLLACALMSGSVYSAQWIFADLGPLANLVISVFVGVSTYAISVLLFLRPRLGSVARILRPDFFEE